MNRDPQHINMKRELVLELMNHIPEPIIWLSEHDEVLGFNMKAQSMCHLTHDCLNHTLSYRLAQSAPTQKQLLHDAIITRNDLDYSVMLLRTQTVPASDDNGWEIISSYLFSPMTTANSGETHEIYQYMENIIAAIPISVYWMNTDYVYLGCSDDMAQLLQLKSRHDIVGKTYHNLYDERSAAYYKKADQEVITTGISLSVEEPMFQPDGTQKTYLSKKVPLKNAQGRIIGMLGISVNITDRILMEKELKQAKELAEAASRAKTEFLDNMRHDIRTPLTGIVGFADLLKLESDNPHIKEYSENLVASSHALLDLLDEVLEAIRVGSGEIPKLKKKFSLEKTLNQVLALNRARASEKRLSLSLHLDKALPLFVIGDKVRLHRVALELVANALNFTDSGFVTLKALLAKKEEGKLVLKLIVEDSGIGIPKERQQDIYVQFKRLTPSYQGIYKGVGLGLSVVKQFIDELSGEIYVVSEVRKGTTFTCLIPLQLPLIDDASGIDDELERATDRHHETTFAQQIKPTIKKETQAAFHVLVVEDNPIAQTIAQTLLTKMQCSVDVAGTGKEAIEYWRSTHYDLILMDIGLPDMDGYEVTHQIRIQELDRKTHCPIIALTAHAGDENKQRCIQSGMNAVLTKPLTATNCLDLLNAFIPGYQTHEPSKDMPQIIMDLPKSEELLFDLSTYPILDITEGLKTTGTEDTLAKMLRCLIDDSLTKDLPLIKKAHADANWDKTQQLAHKIKGGAVYVGTIKLKMACQYLERYWKSGQHELLETLYEQMMDVIELSVKEINQWLIGRP